MICSCCGEDKSQDNYYKKSKQCKACSNRKRKERDLKKKNEKIEKVNDVNVIDFSGSYEGEQEEIKDNISFDGFGNDLMVGMMSDTLKQVFKLVSKRAGKHWIIDNDESMSISKPTINLLSKSKFYSSLMENADIVSLFTALGFIVLPRVMKTVKDSGGVRENDRNDKNRKTDNRNEKTENEDNNRTKDILSEIANNGFNDDETVNF